MFTLRRLITRVFKEGSGLRWNLSAINSIEN